MGELEVSNAKWKLVGVGQRLWPNIDGHSQVKVLK